MSDGWEGGTVAGRVLLFGRREEGPSDGRRMGPIKP